VASLYKDLSIFDGIDLSRTLIVDNQVFSFATHLSNGIPIAGFYGSKKDCELIKIMKYVRQIADEEDLMVANERMF
jgi:CTD small phosphatase-like protein 2